MATYLILHSGARKPVKPLEGLRCLKALKWPEKCSEELVAYVRKVKDVEFDTDYPDVQGRLPYKENREL